MMIIASLEKEIKDFEQKKKEAFSVEDITRFNDKLDELRDKLAFLNSMTNKMSGFGKKGTESRGRHYAGKALGIWILTRNYKYRIRYASRSHTEHA